MGYLVSSLTMSLLIHLALSVMWYSIYYSVLCLVYQSLLLKNFYPWVLILHTKAIWNRIFSSTSHVLYLKIFIILPLQLILLDWGPGLFMSVLIWHLLQINNQPILIAFLLSPNVLISFKKLKYYSYCSKCHMFLSLPIMESPRHYKNAPSHLTHT